MRLLRQTPDSVLWLRAGSEEMQANLRREAAARSVDPQRIVFAPAASYENNIARLAAADLFLDTIPFNAGATASDALWAGVPVLTIAGEAFASRMAGSLLHSLGFSDLITEGLDHYERRALELARAPELLGRLRERLGTEGRRSVLFDTQRCCRHLEAAYREMFERCQRRESPESFAVASIGT